MSNVSLTEARASKSDEFYTDSYDIQKEINFYTDKFKDKTVFCNCDDPFESNFTKFFLMNFNRLGLKKLITTSYKTSTILGTVIGNQNEPYVLQVTDTKKYLIGSQTDLNYERAKCLVETEAERIISPLTGNTALNEEGSQIQIFKRENREDKKTGKLKKVKVKKDLYYEAGDFRSDMSLNFLKESDIVVTNVPFHLFSEFIKTMIKYDKQFLILGNQNAVTYKDVFPLIKYNKLWYGPSITSGDRKFFVPNTYPLAASSCGQDEYNRRFIRIKGVRWFTNIDHIKRHVKMPLELGYKYYGHEEMYPKYDSFDAINVNKMSQIPYDYFGVIGVPITFLDHYCKSQFRIIGHEHDLNGDGGSYVLKGGLSVNGKFVYKRILIKRII